MLKNRKMRGQAAPPSRSPPNNKRYLILTYAAEFDRVHYPLPLIFEDTPDPETLKVRFTQNLSRPVLRFLLKSCVFALSA